MHRYTNGAGWIASGLAGLGASVGTAAQGAGFSIVGALVTVTVGVLTGVATRVAFDLAGRIGLRPKPVDCPIGYAHCPLSPEAKARASAHDLGEAARATTPD